MPTYDSTPGHGPTFDDDGSSRPQPLGDGFAELIEDAPDLIARVDRQARLRYVNGAARRVLGALASTAPAALLGRQITVAGDGGAVFGPWERAIEEVFATGEPRELDLHLPAGEGPRTYRARLTPVSDAPGSPVTSVITVARDVTEQRCAERAVRDCETRFRELTDRVADRGRLEAELQQAQKMEVVGQLAGGVAHDFNNLLAVINGCAELVLDALPPGDSTREDVLEIKRAGERAATLTTQLLAFSRRQVLRPQRMDLNAVVQDTLRMAQRLIGENIRLETALSPALDAVMADRAQIEQVLLNLAVNARDAMPLGGTLTITTAPVRVDEEVASARSPRALAAKGSPLAPGVYASVSVRDTGCGMDAATAARVFEPFFTTKPAGKGTGLGLSTVYGIVKQSQGTITVDSAPGAGTTFTCCLPCAAPQATPISTVVPSTRRPTGGATILVVEDEAAVRAVTRRVLQKQGHTVLEAENGERALEVFRANRGAIRLVVTDVVMPVMSGRELAERLAAIGASTPVLFTSGYIDDVVLLQGELPSSIAFLAKPVAPDALVRKVREMLDTDAARPDAMIA